MKQNGTELTALPIQKMFAWNPIRGLRLPRWEFLEWFSVKNILTKS